MEPLPPHPLSSTNAPTIALMAKTVTSWPLPVALVRMANPNKPEIPAQNANQRRGERLAATEGVVVTLTGNVEAVFAAALTLVGAKQFAPVTAMVQTTATDPANPAPPIERL